MSIIKFKIVRKRQSVQVRVRGKMGGEITLYADRFGRYFWERGGKVYKRDPGNRISPPEELDIYLIKVIDFD